MYRDFVGSLLSSYRRALGSALPVRPPAARHWVDPSRLTWLGLLEDGAGFQLAFSLGRLRVPPVGVGLHTLGVFRLVDAVFPGVDAAGLSASLGSLVPPEVGAARAFLSRAVARLALAEVALELAKDPRALPLPTAEGFEVAVPAKAEALEVAALTPRVPEAGAERVAAGLALLEPSLARRLECLFAAPEAVLLAAVSEAPGGQACYEARS